MLTGIMTEAIKPQVVKKLKTFPKSTFHLLKKAYNIYYKPAAPLVLETKKTHFPTKPYIQAFSKWHDFCQFFIIPMNQ